MSTLGRQNATNPKSLIEALRVALDSTRGCHDAHASVNVCASSVQSFACIAARKLAPWPHPYTSSILAKFARMSMCVYQDTLKPLIRLKLAWVQALLQMHP
eukprot:1145165-Pelagomonas_calceolata.AAC.2